MVEERLNLAARVVKNLNTIVNKASGRCEVPYYEEGGEMLNIVQFSALQK